jgi:hypothetical protein
MVMADAGRPTQALVHLCAGREAYLKSGRRSSVVTSCPRRRAIVGTHETGWLAGWLAGAMRVWWSELLARKGGVDNTLLQYSTSTRTSTKQRRGSGVGRILSCKYEYDYNCSTRACRRLIPSIVYQYCTVP